MKTSASLPLARFNWLPVTLAWLVFAPLAHAHIESGQAGGFATGFGHPWSGWDHVIAMIAVGLWGAQLGAPGVWVLPVTFPLVMAIGGFLGLIGVPLPGVEIGIAFSAVLLGGLVATEVKVKVAWAAAIVGVFGLFHGHAHGTELPEGQNGLLYSMGFVIATGLLHGVGIVLGLVHRWPAGRVVVRLGGAAIMMGGLVFLTQALRSV